MEIHGSGARLIGRLISNSSAVFARCIILLIRIDNGLPHSFSIIIETSAAKLWGLGAQAIPKVAYSLQPLRQGALLLV